MSPREDAFPWLPLYVDDFLTSRWVNRMLLTRPELVGWYVVLLCRQWKDGPLPNDPDELAAVCLTDRARFDDGWRELSKCFRLTPGGLLNDRLEAVRAEQIAKADRVSDGASRAATARWERERERRKDADAMRTHSGRNADLCQLEVEVEKEVEVEVEKKPKKRAGQTDLPDSWGPVESHLKKARELGLNLDDQAESFRLFHRSKGNRYSDWDMAFHTWLRKAPTFVRPTPTLRVVNGTPSPIRTIGQNQGKHHVED